MSAAVKLASIRVSCFDIFNIPSNKKPQRVRREVKKFKDKKLG
jgi:hypothetical protein